MKILEQIEQYTRQGPFPAAPSLPWGLSALPSPDAYASCSCSEASSDGEHTPCSCGGDGTAKRDHASCSCGGNGAAKHDHAPCTCHSDYKPAFLLDDEEI